MSTPWKVGLTLVAVLLVGLVTRELFPKTETLRLPSSTDTVRVTETELDSIIEERVVFRDRVTTDTVNVVTTVFETRLDTIFVLVPRWYLDWATIASRGDTSRYGLVRLGGDSTGIVRQRSVEEHVTLGPVREIRTDSAGLHVEYGEPPRTGISLPLGLTVSPGAVCGVAAGAGLIVGLAVP